MLETYKNLIENALKGQAFPAEPAALYEPIRYILDIGGKRVRPLLVLLGADLFAKDRVEKALPAALAVEMFHNFTLIHDDIMDQAPLRRGLPTVHQKWNSNVGILSGDNLLVLAFQELLKIDSPRTLDVIRVFSETAQEVCEGQQRDMDFETFIEVDQQAYIQMITQKTAVLLGGALKMGALIGGASDGESDLLYQFGTHIGVAFQLQDDWLDVYGQPENVGKQVGGDILANKKTILLVTALQKASRKQREALQKWLSLVDSSDALINQEKVQAIKGLYDEMGVASEVETLQKNHYQMALSALDGLNLPEERLLTLRGLAQSLMTRNH